MNKDYAQSGISFKLLETTRTVNPQWANDGNELAMKKALRKGDYKTLNVYFQNLGDGLLGFCYFPVNNPTADDMTYDGCSILFSSVPGGSTANYNLGRVSSLD